MICYSNPCFVFNFLFPDAEQTRLDAEAETKPLAGIIRRVQGHEQEKLTVVSGVDTNRQRWWRQPARARPSMARGGSGPLTPQQWHTLNRREACGERLNERVRAIDWLVVVRAVQKMLSSVG